jgi:transcription termination factor Rho
LSEPQNPEDLKNQVSSDSSPTPARRGRKPKVASETSDSHTPATSATPAPPEKATTKVVKSPKTSVNQDDSTPLNNSLAETKVPAKRGPKKKVASEDNEIKSFHIPVIEVNEAPKIKNVPVASESQNNEVSETPKIQNPRPNQNTRRYEMPLPQTTSNSQSNTQVVVQSANTSTESKIENKSSGAPENTTQRIVTAVAPNFEANPEQREAREHRERHRNPNQNNKNSNFKNKNGQKHSPNYKGNKGRRDNYVHPDFTPENVDLSNALPPENFDGQSPRPNPNQQNAPDWDKIAEGKERWRELKRSTQDELIQIAQALDIPDATRIRKQSLIYKILEATEGAGEIYVEGVLEILQEGYGFLRSPEHNYLSSPEDIYISTTQIKRFDLKTGDTIAGSVSPPRDGHKYFYLLRIFTINDVEPWVSKKRVHFDNLIPLHPTESFNLEWNPTELSTRMMHIFCPIGKGQRGVILAPPRTGKTVLMQSLANAISQNHPEAKLIVLLIDERHEEVTDMKRSVKGEVISSTFDEPPERHIQVADMVIEKAKRMVENGHDVVILLDSITRFARANNVVIPHSGKILSGGVDANAMQRPKRFFGAARNIENGGSLTILGTALIDTGSKMDEVIFEEFKGTGNMELVLDRKLSEKRIWPAIDIFKSGTRKEEYLLSDEDRNKIWILRGYLQDFTPQEVVQFMKDKLSKSKNRDEFLMSMNK